jgi:uncharacterized protein
MTLMADPHAPYLEAWRLRWRESADRRRKSVAEAREKASRCARLLADRFGARRVWLYGSILREDRFDPGYSDIDLAVEGLSGDFWKALSAVSKLAHPVQVDLREIEAACPELRDVILSEGEILHGSPP